MSIESLLGNQGRCSFVKRARNTFESFGLPRYHVDVCMSLAMRYALAHGGEQLDRVPDVAFDAIMVITSRSLAGCITGSGYAVPDSMKGVKTSRDEYWLTKVSTSLGINAWIDDSLEKWYVDVTHPLFDVMIQACRKRVLPALLSWMETGVTIDVPAILEQISSDLLGKFPVLGRFSRHMPRAILDIIESHITGEPLSGYEPPVATPAGASGLSPFQPGLPGLG
ncbi:MAG: hypothetical protein ACTSUE_23780 [Promethearchaeota archaeon]